MSFFVCNKIGIARIPKHARVRYDSEIENVNAEKLAERSQYSLLVGMGGIGKSMMMRHLFLTSNREYPKTKKLPILVTLREFSSDNDDLLQVVVDSVHRFDMSFSAAHVHTFLSEGKCQLFLDGLDEIKASDMHSFQKQLDLLIDRFPKNLYVMSTRRISSFVELPRFAIFWMLPFTNEQAIELIDKLDFCPENPLLKSQFKKHLVNEYFETHEEFVTNPLLLTLMLMNYRRFADVPEKKYLFYLRAYDTLLQRHDSDKIAYQRVFRSVTDSSDFTRVFSEFCARSYRKGDYEFTPQKFSEYFNKLKALERSNRELMKEDNFLFDMCHSACLMYEEGQSYHFLHRSFQEYFFADYYARQDDDTLKKLGSYLDKKPAQDFDDGDAYEMLYDLDPSKTERFIIMPYLESIFEKDVGGKNYWLFLQRGFDSWIYMLLDEDTVQYCREKYRLLERYPTSLEGLEPTSVILSLILRILRSPSYISIGAIDDSFKYKELVVENIYGEFIARRSAIMPLLRIPKDIVENPQRFEESGLKDRLAFNDDGTLLELGHVYCFDFTLAITEPEKFRPFIDMWEREGFETMKLYNKVKAYYDSLKAKYSHLENEEDDDDF